MGKRRNRKKAKRVARSPHAPELQCNNRHKRNIMMLNVLGNGQNCMTSQWSLTTTITLSEHLCQMKQNSLEEFLRYHSQQNRRSQRPRLLKGKVNPLFLWYNRAFVQTYWNFPEGVQEIHIMPLTTAVTIMFYILKNSITKIHWYCNVTDA